MKEIKITIDTTTAESKIQEVQALLELQEACNAINYYIDAVACKLAAKSGDDVEYVKALLISLL